MVAANGLAYAIYDGFPVTKGHALIIPKRHVENYFAMTQEEVLACNQLMHQLKSDIEKEDRSVVGFNIGANAGEAAGQTIFHSHIHLIPRRIGDVDNPRGGVRGVIMTKQNY